MRTGLAIYALLVTLALALFCSEPPEPQPEPEPDPQLEELPAPSPLPSCSYEADLILGGYHLVCPEPER